MSQHSTRWPSSAKATARLSVVVVLATPPFWLANAMTLAVASRELSPMRRGTHTRLYSQCEYGIPPRCGLRLRPACRSLDRRPDLRHRQGRRRQVDGRRSRSGSARRAARAAHDRRRAGRPGARPAGFEHDGDAVPGGASSRRGLFTISIDPQHAMEEYLRIKVGPLGPRARLEPAVPRVRDGHARDARAARASARCGSWRSSSARRRGAAPYDLVDRRRAGDRARRRRSCARRAPSPRSRASARSPARAARSPRRSPTRLHRPWSRSRLPRRCRSTRRSRCATR